MKKTILTLALVATSFAALAQGRISIANDSGRLFELGSTAGTTPATTGDAAGAIPGAELPSGTTIALALYAGTTSGSMTLQTSYALTGASFLTAGRGATKPFTLVNVPGGVPQFFNIVLCDLDTVLPSSINGALYTRNAAGTVNEDALASLVGATYYGSSGLFQFTPSTSAIAAPALNGTGTTWEAGSIYINTTVIPEPTSMALAGLGAAALLIFRRRK